MDSDMDMIALYRPSDLVCAGGRCHDYLPTFLYCVIAPVVMVTILLLVLVIVMFCWRKACKCKKYSSLRCDTNDIQMESYNTIRRASATLRQMSQNRETPMMGSRAGSMTLDRSYRRARRGRESCHSAPGTLQRQHRNRHSVMEQTPQPPAYSVNSDDVFFGSEFLASGRDMQTSVHYEDNPMQASAHHEDNPMQASAHHEDSPMQTSVHSEYNPGGNGNGAQPLLYQHRYQ